MKKGGVVHPSTLLHFFTVFSVQRIHFIVILFRCLFLYTSRLSRCAMLGIRETLCTPQTGSPMLDASGKHFRSHDAVKLHNTCMSTYRQAGLLQRETETEWTGGLDVLDILPVPCVLNMVFVTPVNRPLTMCHPLTLQA